MSDRYYNIKGYDTTLICKYKKNTLFFFNSEDKHCVSVDVDTKHDTAYVNVLNGTSEEQTHIALYTATQLIPSILKLILLDNCAIEYVDGSKLYTLNLASEYIFKYNQTWYEKTFGALLPEPIYKDYKDSLYLLDEPLRVIKDDDDMQYMNKYQDIYLSSKSPRDFITKLRNIYGDKYCMEVGPWLHTIFV
jgi:hypothetical protein